MLKHLTTLSLLLSALAFSGISGAAEDQPEAEDETALEVVIVTGVGYREALSLDTGRVALPGLDNSDLMRMFPGGNRNANGPVTRISQYRGLFGAQNNVAIDGLGYTPGGPNWMDAPLSSIPQSLTETITLHRGLGSVNVIEEGLGNSIRIDSRRGDFRDSGGWSNYGHLETGSASNASGWGLSLFTGVHDSNNWLDVAASTDQGDDYGFDGGTVAATEYDRNQYRLRYGRLIEQTVLQLGAVINRTGVSGTPALPMDIIYFDSEQYDIGLESPVAGGRLVARANTLSVDHLMNNFKLRQPPANGMGMIAWRETLALSDAEAFKLSYEAEWNGKGIEIGLDGVYSTHDADISNPKNDRFFITNFNKTERDRLGVYAMILISPGNWDLEAGIRYNRVSMNAGEVGGSLGITMPMDGPAAPMMQMLLMQQGRLDELADAFNQADREQDDHQWSGVLKASRGVGPSMRLNLGLARKVRSPSYQERYLWLPMEATAGLADGRTYLGDIDLEPEKSVELTAGLDWTPGPFKLTPELFYREVENYIQGVASGNQTANQFAMMMTGKPPLQFANVDAELYGLDLGYEWQISDAWLLRGNLGFVRGKRTDVDDNLYRIAPLSSFAEVSWSQNRWFLAAENLAAARQDRVADFNGERETPGWGIVNLRAGVRLGSNFHLSGGVENLADKAYQDHLGGYNRVVGGDIPVGQRLYSKGRNYYLRLNADW